MKLYKKVSYRLNGKDFNDLREVRLYIESRIGNIIDSSSLRLSPKDRLSVFESILNHKNELRELLGIEVELEDETQNILDLEL